MDRIMPLPIKRYDTMEDFKLLFQKFLDQICIPQNDPNFNTLFGQVEKLVCLNIPNKLYKYRQVDKFSIESLREDNLVCSKPIDFNDPFDSLLYFDIKNLEQFIEDNSQNKDGIIERWKELKKQVIEWDSPLGRLDSHTRKMLLSSEDEINDYFRSGAFEQNLQALKNECRSGLSSMKTSFQEQSYVGCLTEKNDCPLMWGHYGESHKGFCLEYDLSFNPFWQENFKQDAICHTHIFPVLYSKERYCAREFALQQVNRIMGGNQPLDDTLFWLKTLTSKAINWEYENEWRIIIIQKNIDDTNDERYFLPLRAKAIYYGLRFEEQKEDVKSVIRELAKIKGLHQYKMELKEDDKFYTMSSIPIDCCD